MFFLFVFENVYCGHSLEASNRSTFNENQKHMLLQKSFFCENVCNGYSLEMTHWGLSIQYQQTMLLWRNEKIFITRDKRGIRKIFFLFLHVNICCGYSLEVPRGGTSNEYPQRMFLWTNKRNINNFWLKKCLIWSYVYTPLILVYEM